MSTSMALIGVGHIGGSMAAGLRAAGAVHAIHGYDSNPQALEQARDLDLIDTAHPTPEAAAGEAELIVLATPPSVIAAVCQNLEPHIAEHQVVTDVGSIKKPVLHELERACGRVPSWFVPGHPISGTEKSGAQHANSGLFRDRRVVLTPVDGTDSGKVERVCWMWEQLGAQVERMDADAHDALFAGTSHLPHVLAYALMDVLTEKFPPEELKRYAAGGLLDFTRIASSNPELWLDICQANREHLTPILEQFRERIGELIEALHNGQSDVLHGSFTTAKKTRDTLRPDGHD
ncbi:MAG: prephenate dehydrogenase/arogenate dehydrogenase family protein [Gammaproteobacteria bacterium]|nr:prephenate dehydrogenase/arogenate dehydrogenase family protein [Gammaproteobacteria bacterium]